MTGLSHIICDGSVTLSSFSHRLLSLTLYSIMATSKVSFTVRRPTPISRGESSGTESDGSSFKVPSLPRHLTNSHDSAPGSPLARSNTSSPKPKIIREYSSNDVSSDEEDDTEQDELVTGFDRFGVQRCVSQSSLPTQPSQLTAVPFNLIRYSATPRKAPQGPLVIAPLKNRDWRELARKRRTAGQFVPASGKAQTGADGSVGGLGTRDTINSGPVLSGLQVGKKSRDVKQEDEPSVSLEDMGEPMKIEEDAETEEQLAIRAILAGAEGQNTDGPIIDIIPTPVSETDAFKQDVEELPESSTLDDYARVPVSQFGAALLRGMGWKAGTAATRKPGKGLVQPYLPEARPALLGLGAKEREPLDDGDTKKGGAKRPERRYVPVTRKEKDGSSVPESRPDSRGEGKRRERSGSPRRGTESAASSRRGSPDRNWTYDDGRRDSRRHERSDRGYDRDRDRRDRDRDRHRSRERGGESSRRRD